MSWVLRISTSMLVVAIAVAGCSPKTETFVLGDEIVGSPEDVAAIRAILDEANTIQRAARTNAVEQESPLSYEARAIFEAFWNPKNLHRYGRREWGIELYAETEYLLTQSKLLVAKRRNSDWSVAYLKHLYREMPDEEEWEIEEIEEFAPIVDMDSAVVLHLTPDLSQSILDFLGFEMNGEGAPTVKNTAQSKGVYREKLAAASSLIGVFPMHWGGWHVESQPKVGQILISGDGKRAVVSFRIVYEGGYAFMEKGADGWRLTESAIDWIQ